MKLSQMQQRVDEWMSQFEAGYWPPLANLARLSEEVGELAREINHRYGPKTKKASEKDGAIADELGDILFTVVTLANSMDIDLDDVAEAVLRKVTERDTDRWEKKAP
jgi:NTP pyrophosphatase (non-canonical NTP hydrolase)